MLRGQDPPAGEINLGGIEIADPDIEIRMGFLQKQKGKS